MNTGNETTATPRLVRALAFARRELGQDFADDWIRVCAAAGRLAPAGSVAGPGDGAEAALEDLYAREHAGLLREASALRLAHDAERPLVQERWERWRHRARSGLATARSDGVEPPAHLDACTAWPPRVWGSASALELALAARALANDPESIAALIRARCAAGQTERAAAELAALERRGWRGEVRDARAFERDLARSLTTLLHLTALLGGEDPACAPPTTS